MKFQENQNAQVTTRVTSVINMEKECGLKIGIYLSTLCLIFFHIYFVRCSSGNLNTPWFPEFQQHGKECGLKNGICLYTLCVFFFHIYYAR